MKKIIFSLLGSLLFASITQAACPYFSSAVVQDSDYFTVTAHSLNCRMGPGTDWRIDKVLYKGTYLENAVDADGYAIIRYVIDQYGMSKPWFLTDKACWVIGNSKYLNVSIYGRTYAAACELGTEDANLDNEGVL